MTCYSTHTGVKSMTISADRRTVSMQAKTAFILQLAFRGMSRLGIATRSFWSSVLGAG